MVGKHISAVNIRAVYIARNPKGSSRRRRAWLPETNPPKRAPLIARERERRCMPGCRLHGEPL
jgi:hypothetical protein